MVGRDDGDRLALVTDLGRGQYRLVEHLHAEPPTPGHVLVGQDRGHSGDAQRGGYLDRADARPWVGRAQGGTPEHVRHPQVGGKRELTGHLERSIWPQRARAYAAVG